MQFILYCDMSSSNIPHIVIQSSFNYHKMSMVGFGTGSTSSTIDTKEAVLEAIKIGYRHFDTASIYGSEQPLGEAIAEALQLGLITSRDELFITSKLWCTDNFPHLVLPAIHKTLRCHKLENLLSFATIPPSVNQVEMNPTWQQKKLREYCQAKGIVITAYSPLGAPGTLWGSNYVVDNELVKQIAKAHGKSFAQVSLRWLYEIGVTIVVKSYNKERMKQNIEIFDWALSKDDYDKIAQVKQHQLCKNGPTKFIENLYDGEN
ncbi:NAD(P)H-dependent 6'-deoxychalcone synthase [Vigna angularis]|uniref:NAD(P)H-dependent 6'-deoxychalcone synthase n=1 Tax=Phaseolus angularis TaxID=3914 RepID=A0A8T0KGT8_PHAAN|nr:NAD(P)H-dependent 6'-deoxychalcone synthase [Vigna angularis]